MRQNTIKVEVAGQVHDVAVDDVSGRFSITIGTHEYLSDESLPALKDKIRKAVKKRQTNGNVEVAIIQYGKVKRLRLVQFTADERNIRTKDIDTGKAGDQISSHTTVYRPFTADEEQTQQALMKAKQEAEKAYDDFMSGKLFDPKNKYASTANNVLQKDIDARVSALDEKQGPQIAAVK